MTNIIMNIVAVVVMLSFAVLFVGAIMSDRRRERRHKAQMEQQQQNPHQPQPRPQGGRPTPQDVYREYTTIHQSAIHQASQAAAQSLQNGPIPEALSGRIVLGAPIYTDRYKLAIAPLHAQVMRRERILKILEILTRK